MPKSVVINDKTKDAVKKIRGLSRKGATEFSETMLTRSKEAPPEGAPVLTGNLRSSLEWELVADSGDTSRARLFSTAGYGGFVHEGTARQQANPFFQRAAQRTIQDFQDGQRWGE